MTRIDLNCDMGESFGAWQMGADTDVLPWVSSVNIACGFHAGDPAVMRRTVTAAVEAGVTIGAHVGLPDLAGFGRRAMALRPQEAYDLCIVQIGALSAVAATCGTSLAHMKPHGALYHMAEHEPDLARALAQAVHDLDPGMRLVGRSGGQLVDAGQGLGLPVAHEVFADRRYQTDGQLVPRSVPGAVIEGVDEAATQALELAMHGRVRTLHGTTLELRADTLCIHGDRPDAEAMAQGIHQILRAAGVAIGPFAR